MVNPMGVCLRCHLHPLCMLQWNIFFGSCWTVVLKVGWSAFPHCCLLVVGPEGVASVDQLGGMCHCVLIPLHELVANDLSG